MPDKLCRLGCQTQQNVGWSEMLGRDPTYGYLMRRVCAVRTHARGFRHDGIGTLVLIHY